MTDRETEIPSAEPVFGKPALKIRSGNHTFIAIADLHIGHEYSLLKKGVTVKSRIDEIMQDIFDIIMKEKPDHLVIVGDLKDELFGMGAGTERQILRFFSKICRVVGKVTLVKGNHDGQIEDFLPEEVELIGPKGGRINDVGFFHGHAWPLQEVMECPLVVTAHNHPTFGSILGGEKDHHHPCWVRGRWDTDAVIEHYTEAEPEKLAVSEVVILPSFTKIGKGVVVNRGTTFLGPVLSNGLLDIRRSKAYLLNGTELGGLDDLKEIM